MLFSVKLQDLVSSGEGDTKSHTQRTQAPGWSFSSQSMSYRLYFSGFITWSGVLCTNLHASPNLHRPVCANEKQALALGAPPAQTSKQASKQASESSVLPYWLCKDWGFSRLIYTVTRSVHYCATAEFLTHGYLMLLIFGLHNFRWSGSNPRIEHKLWPSARQALACRRCMQDTTRAGLALLLMPRAGPRGVLGKRRSSLGLKSNKISVAGDYLKQSG